MTALIDPTPTKFVGDDGVIKIYGLTGKVLSGLALIILAFAANYQSIQRFNMKQMELAATLQDNQAKEAAAAIKAMEDGPIKDIQNVMNNPDLSVEAKNALVSEYTANLNVMNTAYNQKNTVFSGIIQGVNQNSSDTTQTLQTDLQMMGTNGVLATMQTITQCIA